MFGFGKKDLKAASILEDDSRLQDEPDEEAAAPAPWGDRALHLTQFGTMWIDVSKIVWINLEPEDGCGVEIGIRGWTHPAHFHGVYAAAVKAWLAMNAEGVSNKTSIETEDGEKCPQTQEANVAR
jgi:hypothetical protein